MTRVIFILLVLGIQYSVFSQCGEKQFGEFPFVVINEVHNGSSTEGDEYIELLVVGSYTDDETFIALPDLIVDDNHAWQKSVGTEPGHVVIRSQCLLNARPGDLIVVYGEGVDVGQVSGDFVFALTSNCLELYEAPHNIWNSYTNPQPYEVSPPQWRNLLAIRDDGDIVQVRDLNNQIHYIPTGNQTNYSLGGPDLSVYTQESPTIGLPNNGENQDFINQLKNENGIEVTCSIVDGNSVRVSVDNGQAPYIISGDLESNFSDWVNNQALTGSLDCGSYIVIVTDADGCSASCEAVIEETGTYNITTCPGGFVELLSPSCGQMGDCYHWESTANSISSEMANSNGLNIRIYEDQTIVGRLLDGDGNVISTVTYNITITEQDTDGDGVCDNDDEFPNNSCIPFSTLQVSISGEFEVCASGFITASDGDYYEWSNGETSQSISVTSSGTYAVTVYDTDGCTGTASQYITVLDGSHANIEGDMLLCKGSTGVLTASGGNDYNWSTGSTENNINITEGGVYMVTVTNSYGCESVASIEVVESNFPDADNDGICEDEDIDDNDPCVNDNPISIEVDGALMACQGATAKLIVRIVGGEAPFNLAYFTEGSNNPVFIETNDRVHKIEANAGKLRLFVGDANNCVNELQVYVQDSDSPDSDGDGLCDNMDEFPDDECNQLAVAVQGNITLCLEDEYAEVEALISGGQEPYQIEWSNGQSDQNATLSIQEGVYYNVKVVDANNCEVYAYLQLARSSYEELSVIPKNPSVCPNSSVELKSKEIYDTYEWTLEDNENSILSTDRTLIVDNPGIYILKTSKTVEGNTCNYETSIRVRDLTESSDIEEYLLAEGFYSISIFLDQEVLRQEMEAGSRSDEDCTSFIPFSFDESLDPIQEVELRTRMSDIMDDFKVLSHYENKSSFLTQNACFCADQSLDEMSDEFEGSQAAIWIHELVSESDGTAKLFVKGKLPFYNELPYSDQHRNHLISLQPEIFAIENNASSVDQASVIMKNVFMPNILGGFDELSWCADIDSYNEDAYFVSPADVPIKVDHDYQNVAFSVEEEVIEGSLLQFEVDQNQYRAYAYDGLMFSGYYNAVKGVFYEELITANDQINIVQPYVCQEDCSFIEESLDYSDEVFNSSGGFGKELKNEISSHRRIYSSKMINAGVSEILCAIRNGDSTIENPFQMKDIVVRAQDVYLGEHYFAHITMSFNNDGALDISDFEIAANSNLGYLNGINFESDDLYITVQECCKFPLLQFHPQIPDGILCYNIDDVGVTKLHNYLNPVEENNLLLFVNGYRANSDLFSDNGRVGYNSSDYASVRCGGEYSDSGSYWDETGRLFTERIGHDNILYLDGHDDITTSNHNDMGVIYESKLKFARSAAYSYYSNNDPSGIVDWLTRVFSPAFFTVVDGFITHCESCDDCPIPPPNTCDFLNTTPNTDGFEQRYNNGYTDGLAIWQDVLDGNVKVASVQENGETKISGKIDIVAHSMGYAHAVGVASALVGHLADGNTLGRFYVLAPENACNPGVNMYSSPIDGALDIYDFQEVWQYGANETDPVNFKIYELDGVAPQCAVPGLSFVEPVLNTQGNPSYGRISFDGDDKKKNFVDIHLGSNYGWVLNKIIPGRIGFVKERND